LKLSVVRGADTLPLTVKPVREPSSQRGLIGIAPSSLTVEVGFFESLERGVKQCWLWSALTVKYLGEKIMKREKPELSGPIGIASVVAKAAHSSAQDFWTLIALISVGIGLFNIFPIPMLDGGHLVFYLWEGLTKRPVTQKVMAMANAVGLSVLLGILVFATYSDIQRIRVGRQMEKDVQPAQAPAAPAAADLAPSTPPAK
jgi:regulator of sigma E protease